MTAPPAAIAYRLDLPHGHCVGVAFDPDQADGTDADPAELAHAATLGPARQPSFLAGRRALRLALTDLGFPGTALLPAPGGGPHLPPGALGSLSHKRTRAVGLATRRADDVVDVGVDLEELRPLRADIAPRVLTPGERQMLDAQPTAARDRFVLERFSLKEAFWKAVNHHVGPRISFQAVEVVAVASDGSVQLSAPWLTEQGWQVQGWLGCPESGFILSSVRLSSSRFAQPSRA
jgi:4'-phosphopantetheinyl transferase EntD